MKRFFERYNAADPKLLRSVAILPWGRNLLIMNKASLDEEALFYATKTLEVGWTRDVLLNYIKADAYQAKKSLPKSHNFGVALP